MPSPKSKNEAKRLEVLWQYDVLDTVPEEVFDELTNLAAMICDAPIALISLVDEDRQWFKAKTGITISETSRDISFCAHAIMGEGLFVVPDAMKDERFKNNPLVTTNPKIRFYAGAPLVAPSGHALGTLCILDKVPRTLSPEQQKLLSVLAHHIMTQLELRRHAHKLTEANKSQEQLKTELAQAKAEIGRLRKKLAKFQKASSPVRPKTAARARR